MHTYPLSWPLKKGKDLGYRDCPYKSGPTLECPGTTFSIRIYKNGVKGISASVLGIWKWELAGFRFPIQIYKPRQSHMTCGLLTNYNNNNVAVILFIKHSYTNSYTSNAINTEQ